MADQSSQSIVIDAPPAAVMAVIADFPAYPKWARSVKSAEVVAEGADGRAEQVHFVIDAGVVTTWRSTSRCRCWACSSARPRR